MINLRFSSDEMDAAFDAWGCNCGPTALAAAAGLTLIQVKPLVMAAGFESRGHMNPTMMKAAVVRAGFRINAMDSSRYPFATTGVTRIQFCGPWTEMRNAKWAYRYTHWVASCWDRSVLRIFDCNAGLVMFEEWRDEVVPKIVASIARASGKWIATHAWEIVK